MITPFSTYPKLIDKKNKQFKFTQKALNLFIFSDSIVIEGIDNDPMNFWNIVFTLLSFQFQMLEKGILLRGGIAYGKHFHEHGILVSPAMVRAYQLEQRATYPRIIIDKVAKQNAYQHMVEQNGEKGIAHDGYFVPVNPDHILEDFDGEYALSLSSANIDYLKYNRHPDFKNLNLERIQHCVTVGNSRLKTIQEALKKAQNNCSDEKVIQKFGYINNKWNDYILNFYHKDKLESDYSIKTVYIAST